MKVKPFQNSAKCALWKFAPNNACFDFDRDLVVAITRKPQPDQGITHLK